MERLSSEQEALLAQILKQHEPGILTSAEDTHLHRELAEEGYFNDYKPYLDGTASFIVSSKGKAYFEEVERSDREKKADSSRSWRQTVVNGLFTILGLIVGFLLGLAFSYKG